MDKFFNGDPVQALVASYPKIGIDITIMKNKGTYSIDLIIIIATY